MPVSLYVCVHSVNDGVHYIWRTDNGSGLSLEQVGEHLSWHYNISQSLVQREPLILGATGHKQIRNKWLLLQYNSINGSSFHEVVITVFR